MSRIGNIGDVGPAPPEVVRGVTGGGLYGTRLTRATGDLSLDLVEGHELTITPEGPRIVVTGRVTGLEGDASQKLISAATHPNMPRMWDYHPVLTDLPLTNINVRPVGPSSPDTVDVVLTYAYTTGGTYFVEPPSDQTPPQIEVCSTVQSAKTEFYLVDNPNSPVDWQYQIFTQDRDQENGEWGPKKFGKVDFYEPMLIVRYRRREFPIDSHGRKVGDKAKEFVGTINKTGVFGDPPHFWMCTRLDATSDDAGASYNVTYEFQRAPSPNGWDATIVHTDDDGNPILITKEPDEEHPYPNMIGAFKTLRIYYEKEFRLLNLGTGAHDGG